MLKSPDASENGILTLLAGRFRLDCTATEREILNRLNADRIERMETLSALLSKDVSALKPSPENEQSDANVARPEEDPESRTLIAENLALLGITESMASSVRGMASTVGTASDSKTVIAPSDSEEVLQGAIHPGADQLSLFGYFPRQSQENVSRWQDSQQHNRGNSCLSSGTSTRIYTPSTPSSTIFEDDGVPTEGDRTFFEDALGAAKEAFAAKKYTEALEPLEVLLPIVRQYAFVDDSAERDVSHLTAAVLVQLGIWDEQANRLMWDYPSVAEEVAPMILETAAVFSDYKRYDAAIKYLLVLHELPSLFPEAEIQVLQKASELLAKCLSEKDLEGEVSTKLAVQFSPVDFHLTRLRTETAMTSKTTDNPRRIVLARLAIEGWDRLKGQYDETPAQYDMEQQLRFTLAELLLEANKVDTEAQHLLVHLTTQHISLELLAKTQAALALSYIHCRDKWELARSHGLTAARLEERVAGGGGYGPSLEIYVRACELLGDPAGKYRRLKKPKSLLPPHEVIGQLLETNFTGDMKEEIAFRIRFLQQHYDSNILDVNGRLTKPCWECMSASMAAANAGFWGWLGITEVCPNGACIPRRRHPVMEFLAATEASVQIGDKGCDAGMLGLSKVLEIVNSERVSSSWPLLDAQTLLRLAIINGRDAIIRLVLDSPSHRFPRFVADTQVATMKANSGRPCSFLGVVEGAGLGDPRFTRLSPRERSPRELKAIAVLVRRLSIGSIVDMLQRTFLPGSIRDLQVLEVVLRSCSRQVLQESFPHSVFSELRLPILHHTLCNIGDNKAIKKADGQWIADAVRLFLEAGSKMDAAGDSVQGWARDLARERGDDTEAVAERIVTTVELFEASEKAKAEGKQAEESGAKAE